MTSSYQSIIHKLNDAEVGDYIANRSKYLSEAVEVAMAELAKRGKGLSGEEVRTIRAEMAAIELKRSDERQSPFQRWAKEIVEDSDAPELYSKRAIWSFCLIITPVFGAALLSMNLYRLGRKIQILYVATAVVLWLALEWILVIRFRVPGVGYLLSLAGAGALTSLAWPRFIGKDRKYRRRSIRAPTVIAVLLLGLFIWVFLARR